MIKPVRHDLVCYKGQTFIQPIIYTRNKQPWSLAGMTVKAEIRPSENSTKLTKEIECSVYGSQGRIELYMNANETASINPGIYVWDMKTIDENDNVIPWLYGKFIVTGRVTE